MGKPRRKREPRKWPMNFCGTGSCSRGPWASMRLWWHLLSGSRPRKLHMPTYEPPITCLPLLLTHTWENENLSAIWEGWALAVAVMLESWRHQFWISQVYPRATRGSASCGMMEQGRIRISQKVRYSTTLIFCVTSRLFEVKSTCTWSG